MPKALNLPLLLSAMCYVFIGLISFHSYLELVDSVVLDITVPETKDIMIGFTKSGAYVMEALLILLTSSFAMMFGFMLSIATLVLFFIQTPLDLSVINIISKVVLPVLGLVLLIIGQRGLTLNLDI